MKTIKLRAILMALSFMLAAMASAAYGETTTTDEGTRLRIVYSGGLEGSIEPCG